MGEKEFEIVLTYLGRDIKYIGSLLQQKVEKCLNDLKVNHDNKKYCKKLADILIRFSEYSHQFAKDLESKIKEYHEDDEYKDITNKLMEHCAGIIGSNTYPTKREGAETSNGLGPPSNKIDDNKPSQLVDPKSETLSQCSSLHIGGDEFKSDRETPLPFVTPNDPILSPHPFVTPNDPVVLPQGFDIEKTTNNLILTEDSSLQQQLDESNHPIVVDSTSNRDNYEEEMDTTNLEVYEDDTDVANSLEISHSEEILSDGEQEEVILYDYNGEDCSNIDNEDQLEPALENIPISEYLPDELPKIDVIPLPYSPLFKKTNDDSDNSKAGSASSFVASSESELTNDSHESVCSQENSKSHHMDSMVSKTDDKATGVKQISKKMSPNIDEDDDSDVEIVSVDSPRPIAVEETRIEEVDDSDIEIIESISDFDSKEAEQDDESAVCNPDTDLPISKQIEQDRQQNNVESSPRMVDNSCWRGPNSNEETALNSPRKSILAVDSEEETVANSPPETPKQSRFIKQDIVNHPTQQRVTEDLSDAEIVSDSDSESPNFDKSTVANSPLAAPLEDVDDDKLSDVTQQLDHEGSESNSDVSIVRATVNRSCRPDHQDPDETNTKTPENQSDQGSGNDSDATIAKSPVNQSDQGSSNDSDATIAKSPVNQSDQGSSNDSDATIARSPVNQTQKNSDKTVIQSLGFDKQASTNDSDDTVITSPLNQFLSEETVIHSQSPRSEHDSDATVVRSPVNQPVLDGDRAEEVVSTEECTEPSQIFSLDESNLTQRVIGTSEAADSQETQLYGANAADSDSDVDYEAPTQKITPPSVELSGSAESTQDIFGDDDNVTKASDTNDSDGNLIGPKDAEAVEGLADVEQDQEDVLTQITEEPQNMFVTEASEQVCDNEVASQESMVFDLGNEQDTEADAPDITNIVEDSGAKKSDKDKESKREAEKEDGNLSASSLEDGSTDAPSESEEEKKTKRKKRKKKLDENERKSLFRVIAEYYRKKKTEKVKKTAQGDGKKDMESRKGIGKKRPRDSSGRFTHIKNKKQRRDSAGKTEKVSNRKDVKKDQKSLSTSHADESSHSDAADDRADSSDDSVIEASQEKKQDEKSTKITEAQETNKSNIEDSNDKILDTLKSTSGKELEQSEASSESTETVGSLNDFLNQLPSKSTDDKTDKNEDAEGSSNDEFDLTLRVTDIRQLKHLSVDVDMESTEQQSKEYHEKQTHSDLNSPVIPRFKKKVRHPAPSLPTDEDGALASQESTIVSPFKKKIIQPLPNTQTDAEDDLASQESTVPSPFKKKAIKPLPDSQSEEDDAPESQESTVPSPFKKKAIKPLPDSQSEEDDAPESQESTVPSPFKKKVIKPIPPSQSDDDNAPESQGSQVVSPYRKKGVKRLLSCDEDESEPAKRTCVKNLTDALEKESAQVVSDREEHETESTSKKRKVQISAGSEFKCPRDLNQVENKEMDGGRSDGNELEDGDDDDDDQVMVMSQFKLDDKARDDFLELLGRRTEDISDESNDVREETNGEQIESTEDDQEDFVLSQFKLDNSGRDNLLNLLSDNEKERNAKSANIESACSNKQDARSSKDKSTTEEVQNNIFQLSDKGRDDLLELLSSKEDRVKDADKNEDSSPDDKEMDSPSDVVDQLKHNEDETGKNGNEDVHSDKELDPSSDKDDELKNKEDKVDKDEDKDVNKCPEDKELDCLNDKDDDLNNNEDGISKDADKAMEALSKLINEEDDIEDSVTDNSEEVDKTLEELDKEIADSDDTDAGEDAMEVEQQKSVKKAAGFQLDEKEKDELLDLLSQHVKSKEVDGKSDDSSESDLDEEMEQTKTRERKKRNKGKSKVDRETLVELLKEYESAMAGKNNESISNVKSGGEEFDRMSMDNNSELLAMPKTNLCQDFGGDSESALMDLLREETIEQTDGSTKKKRGKPKNIDKEAWEAYEQLMKESDDLSDSSSELSDIDLDLDLELDFSDLERKEKEKKLHAKLRKQFNIEKELIVNVEEADISSFDLDSLVEKEAKGSSRIDSAHEEDVEKLCDLSTILQKRKAAAKKQRISKAKKAKKRRSLSLSNHSSFANSDSDSDVLSVTPSSDSSEDSLNRGSSSNRNSLDFSDNDEQQEKLANALWENIKNSSDDDVSGYSCEDDSSDDEENKKKKGSKAGGSRKGKKGKRKVDEEEEDDEDDTESEKSDDDDDDDEDGDGDKGKRIKDTDLDSSDEDDFVGMRRGRGAWKYDPLLKGCLTSDESGSDSGSNPKKRSARIRRRLLMGTDDSDENSEGEKKTETPAKDTENSSDSDVEFVMEKMKTPKKSAEKEDEDDSPSKRGKGRRNIRALVEDDELAEATQMAKKEESERIKRLQERERAKESFTQSQSFGSQLSEEDTDPLILDVQEDVQIKVHPSITKKLKPHQRSGIQFMWDSCYESLEQLEKGYEGSGCILAHCMGLGKTLQALGLIHTVFSHKETKTKHALVVCPLSTVSNWRNEYKLAFKGIRHCGVQLFTIEDKKAADKKFKIVDKWRKSGGMLVLGYECFNTMVNDQKLERWEQQNMCQKENILKALVNPGPDLVICDEGHLLRNKQTQRNLALNRVKTRKRIVLTGTPLQNNLLEYYCMVNFVKPNLLGTEKEYKTNFVNPISNGQFEDSTATDILFMKKRSHVLHKILDKTVQRVEDTELKLYLPKLVDQALFMRLSDLQVKFYNTYLDSANARPVAYTAAGNVSRKNFLADTQILKYICTHPDVVTIAKSSRKSKIKEQDVIDDNMEDAIEDKVFSRCDWYKDLLPEEGVKKLELGTKMTVAMGIVKEAAANKDKVLIFSQTLAEMDSLEFFLKQELKYKKTVDYNRMDGTIIPEVRTHMCDSFNNKKSLKVFIMSTKVGGLGLNLTAANRVILMNVNWNPSYDTQSVFRAFRFGQKKAVYVYRLIAIDTMEEKMYQRNVTKLAVAHRVVDKHQITRHYSAADIQEFYSARPSIEGERPLPNVPEDRILANLIQKYPFLYKWHEHQALLANRPEEDLNEQQKNAAWEEFNRKAVEPPPPNPALPQHVPPFANVSDLLNQPGPSGMQNNLLLKNKLQTRAVNPNSILANLISIYGQHLPAQAFQNFPLRLKQTRSGPQFVFARPRNVRGQTRAQRGVLSHRHRGSYARPSSRTIRDETAVKIDAINSLVSGQTTSGLVSGFNTASTSSFNPANSNEDRPMRDRTIDAINSIISASLDQSELHSELDHSEQEWANDGLDDTLASLDIPDDVN